LGGFTPASPQLIVVIINSDKEGLRQKIINSDKNHNYDSGVYLLRVVSPPGFLLGPQGQSLRSFPFGAPGPPLFCCRSKGGPKPLVVRVVTSGSRSFGKLVGLLPSSRSYVSRCL
jgi:hypothetical protein